MSMDEKLREVRRIGQQLAACTDLATAEALTQVLSQLLDDDDKSDTDPLIEVDFWGARLDPGAMPADLREYANKPWLG